MKIDIASVEVGERRREDYGDLAGLAASIRRYGLIHPVVVDSERRRIRRWQAEMLLRYGRATDISTIYEQDEEE